MACLQGWKAATHAGSACTTLQIVLDLTLTLEQQAGLQTLRISDCTDSTAGHWTQKQPGPEWPASGVRVHFIRQPTTSTPSIRHALDQTTNHLHALGPGQRGLRG